MEQLKYRFLKLLLKCRNEQHVDKYVKAVAAMEKGARMCYAETLDFNEEEFVKSMLLDGCFLIELLRYCGLKIVKKDEDGFYGLNFRHERILSQLHHDILLHENQLPFFVVNQLFNMTKTTNYPKRVYNDQDEFITLAFSFADGMFLNLSVSIILDRLPVKNTDHLFGLLHDVWCLPFAEKIISLEKNTGKNIAKRGNYNNINSTSELQEVGIKFKKAKESNGSLMDIRFVKGVMRIPQLKIFDETESQFRNLIAYE